MELPAGEKGRGEPRGGNGAGEGMAIGENASLKHFAVGENGEVWIAGGDVGLKQGVPDEGVSRRRNFLEWLAGGRRFEELGAPTKDW